MGVSSFTLLLQYTCLFWSSLCIEADVVLVFLSGYGFVDFDSPAAAQKAVSALKTSGVQAQMAKVSTHLFLLSPAAGSVMWRQRVWGGHTCPDEPAEWLEDKQEPVRNRITFHHWNQQQTNYIRTYIFIE